MYIEQSIPRSVDKRRRKMYYSLGKKKRHTIKNQLVANKPGFIIHKANHKKGCSRHDNDDVYKKNHPVIPKEVVVNIFDLDYLAVKAEFPEQISSLPYKKKRNHEVSTIEEKEYNKSHSKKKRY
ncbi:MAG: transposase family protein [Candidatus Nitrosocosmicus sp.]